jgi:TonB family protein
MLITSSAESSSGRLTNPNFIPPNQRLIPEATKPCTAEEAKWWQDVRTAGKVFAVATERKNEAILGAVNKYLRTGTTPEDEKDLLPAKELMKLNQEVSTARETYITLLQEGEKKSYRLPIADGKPLFLQWVTPRYSNEGRKNKINGAVLVRVEILSDGRIGEIEMVRGLGNGLDEKAIEAARASVFLPARQDGRFVPSRQSMSIEFNIK